MSTLSIGYAYIIWADLNSKCEIFKLISPKSWSKIKSLFHKLEVNKVAPTFFHHTKIIYT